MTTTAQPQSRQMKAEMSPVRPVEVTLRSLVPYGILGALFGIILVKSEVASWYRIQEMFRFQSFHMYGVLGSAMLTAFVSVKVLRHVGARTRAGEQIALAPKALGKGYRYSIGGAIFGIGWALSGACPGPLFALAGSGATVYLVTFIAALAGAWTYGYLRAKLPH